MYKEFRRHKPGQQCINCIFFCSKRVMENFLLHRERWKQNWWLCGCQLQFCTWWCGYCLRFTDGNRYMDSIWLHFYHQSWFWRSAEKTDRAMENCREHFNNIATWSPGRSPGWTYHFFKTVGEGGLCNKLAVGIGCYLAALQCCWPCFKIQHFVSILIMAALP